MIIKNETIKKLTTEELRNLGCFDIGIVPVKGLPKARIKGYKTTLRTKSEIHYTNEKANIRVELIKTADTNYSGYAVRYFDMNKQKYDFIYLPVIACEFVKPKMKGVKQNEKHIL